jgi:hypothetical protein
VKWWLPYFTKKVLIPPPILRMQTWYWLTPVPLRDKAEQTVRKRLEKYNAVKKINPKMKVGVLGCMAERLKSKFLEEEKIVDLVVGTRCL